LFHREIGEVKMTRRHVIWFRIFLYISVLLAAFFVNTMVGLGRLSYIFIGLGGPFLLLPIFAVSPWYLRSFRKTKFGFLSFPPLAIIPCWYLIKDRFVKKVQNPNVHEDGDVVFDTDPPSEEKKIEHYDLWKLEHAIALIVTGVMGLISAGIIIMTIFVLLDHIIALYGPALWGYCL
tara:strand:+ start:84 stop:614 length:531 start_codon:yes stop_codon:yes gene_type:complete